MAQRNKLQQAEAVLVCIHYYWLCSLQGNENINKHYPRCLNKFFATWNMSNFLRNNFILLDTKLNGLSESLQAPSTADDWYPSPERHTLFCYHKVLNFAVCLFVSNIDPVLFSTLQPLACMYFLAVTS